MEAMTLYRRACELVHHEQGCPAVGGRGDDDCRCDAVPFLSDLKAHLAQPAQAVDVGALGLQDRLTYSQGTRDYVDGWNDCRAASLVDAEHAAGIIRDVIGWLDSLDGALVTAKWGEKYRDKLTRALSGEKAGPVGDGWQPIETARSDERIIGCWLGAPGCHEVDVAVYVTQGVDRPRWVAPDDSFCEYGKPDLWMPLPQPPGSSDGMDYPDGPWAEGWAERSSVLLTASPTPSEGGKGVEFCSVCRKPFGPTETRVGTGDGTMRANNGRGSFAHRHCYEAAAQQDTRP